VISPGTFPRASLELLDSIEQLFKDIEILPRHLKPPRKTKYKLRNAASEDETNTIGSTYPRSG
jgi:hypothetical protein